MAAVRLHGVLDAAMRAALPTRSLVALADRIKGGCTTTADGALLAAFCAVDLAAVNMRADSLIIEHAAPMRCVLAVMSRGRAVASADDTTPHAVAVVGSVTSILSERLRALPDDDELLRLGDLFERGLMTPADIIVIRALPGQYLRANASARHYPALVDYRALDYFCDALPLR